MRFTDYIWDFDGTLFDSYPLMGEGYMEALRQLCIQADPDEVMKKIKLSIGRASVFFAQGTGIDPKEITARFQLVRRDYHTPLYPGVKKTCAAIAAAGGRNFLYSHRDQSAWVSLRENDMETLFCGGVISSDNFPPKPAPDALNHLAEKYAIDRAKAVMVGDRDIDILSGANAGMAGLLFDPEGFYEEFDTPLKARSFAELARLCGIPGLE